MAEEMPFWKHVLGLFQVICIIILQTASMHDGLTIVRFSHPLILLASVKLWMLLDTGSTQFLPETRMNKRVVPDRKLVMLMVLVMQIEKGSAGFKAENASAECEAMLLNLLGDGGDHELEDCSNTAQKETHAGIMVLWPYSRKEFNFSINTELVSMNTTAVCNI